MKSATNNGLKHARLNKKLSISELAIAINKDTSTIHLWEDGLKAIDSLILEQLSDILDCSTELLLFGEIRESLNINWFILWTAKSSLWFSNDVKTI